MNKLKGILIYFIFPVILISIAYTRQYLFMIPAVLTYFTVFIIIQNENIHKILAGYNSKRGKTDKALQNIYRAYKLKRSTIHTALVFIYMLLKAGKYDKAGEIIKETENKDMTEFEAHSLKTNKALYYWKKNRIPEALALYDDLLKTGESTILYGSYGYVLTLGDDLAKTLEINESAYKYNPNNKAIMDNLGLTYIKTGDLNKAYEIYEELIRRTPRFPEAYYNAAELMRKMNDIDTAVRYIKKCLSMPFNGLSTITRIEAERKLDQLNRLQGSIR